MFLDLWVYVGTAQPEAEGGGHAWAGLLGHDCVKTAEILENLNWTQGVVKPHLERMS